LGGGECQDLDKRPVVKPSETDYLVIAGNGYVDPTHGKNYQKTAKMERAQNLSKKISIIHQLYCEELLTISLLHPMQYPCNLSTLRLHDFFKLSGNSNLKSDSPKSCIMFLGNLK
jgi:hypothetical protein